MRISELVAWATDKPRFLSIRARAKGIKQLLIESGR